jgi:hypothetical protein
MSVTSALYRVQLDACVKDAQGYTLFLIPEQRMGISNVFFGRVPLPEGCPGKLHIPAEVDPVFRTRLGSKPLLTITPDRVALTQDGEVFRFERVDTTLVRFIGRTPLQETTTRKTVVKRRYS